MKTPKVFLLAIFAAVTVITRGVPSFAATSKSRFMQPCESVWAAAIVVAKSQYRLGGVYAEERILSVVTGNGFTPDRTLTLTLVAGTEHGCIASVKASMGSIGYDDGGSLLARIHVQLVSEEIGAESAAFKKYKNCAKSPGSSEEKCEARLRRRLAGK